MAEYLPRRALVHPEDSAPEPRGRRFLDEDAVGDRFYDDAALPRRVAADPPRQDHTTLLSTFIAPVVIAASIGLAVAIGHAVPNEPPSDPVPRPSVTSTEPGPADPTPPPSLEPGQTIALNDAAFTLPASWRIDAEEEVEGDRRAVRVSDPDTDTRLQAVTLATTEDDLGTACTALVDLQVQAFEGAVINPSVPLSVRGDGTGQTCGFSGTRTDDDVSNTVTFQMVQRDDDAHLLVLRSTVPDDVAIDAPARAQLVAMQCEASADFGVRLPLC